MPDSLFCIVIVSEEHLDKIAAMADKIVEMAPRTVDIAAVKDYLGVDELLYKLVSLEEQLASLKLQRKVQGSSPHQNQRSRNRSKSRRHYNPEEKYCYYYFRFGKKCLLVNAYSRAASMSREMNPSSRRHGESCCRHFRPQSPVICQDRETGCRFLVDSGADVSILPWTKTKGADFLQKFQLLIDLHNRKLIDGVTNLSIKGEVATIQENNDLSTVNRASKYFNLLNSYPDLTKPNLVNRVVKHGVKHHILTTGQPVYSKARQLAPDKLKLAKQEFQFMLNNYIIRPSKSQWASPLHLVNKKDGTLRPCGDYRRLNAQTIQDRYPIPRIEDFNHILKDKKYFQR
ncbi:transposon Ty3-I Gag-Pol polyprotein [Trichonephila clavipes]|nr:transposon Ty3-I Gag-Pol polyprotein [Trichonephila clavipes]